MDGHRGMNGKTKEALSFIFSILLFIFLIINTLLNMILVFQFMAFQQCYIKDEQFCL